ncbi:c-type cytochrome biogenesis protein CcsB [Demequina zhanjiangensis]|uniref:C-type cytochrome biogenesis protein CcsB n=1 Tax=Demequina zhanjiangensis TaxID=3051659 RepID=A0ABT8FWW9_9MICO|nr:c-type cytochrome biogenesis protein CcsB [Demequina sp. SYSU T00b26]MDN4471388.1 c-type cytochrome biogenesis protein CcsB [Demequina sp. SYSU T00b26]
MSPQLLSLVTLWAAAALYAIAMVAWSIRLSRVADERIQARQGAGAASSTTAEAAAPAKERVAVGGGDDAAVAAMASGATSFVVDDGDETDLPRRSGADRALGAARAAMYSGLLLHLVGLIARGLDSGHVPWSNMYEYTITGSFVAVAVFGIVQARRDWTFLGAGVTGFATIALGIGLTVLYAESTGLRPALQSFWLVIHVAIAIISTGVFIVAAVATTLQLLQYERTDGERELTGGAIRRLGIRVRNGLARWTQRATWFEAIPSAQKLEAVAFRLNAVGFVLWTFTVMAGAVWAEHAWGRYWGWDPKEVWSFVIWVLYAAYLHARTTQGWLGRRSAWLSIAAFVALIMNFTVVNLFFQGLHTYA